MFIVVVDLSDEGGEKICAGGIRAPLSLASLDKYLVGICCSPDLLFANMRINLPCRAHSCGSNQIDAASETRQKQKRRSILAWASLTACMLKCNEKD